MRPPVRLVRAVVAAVVALGITAPAALAHPLGNFTINHYAGIRVEPERVLVDLVIDQAEIPTFQATMDLDADGDGEFSAEEVMGVELEWCAKVGRDVSLSVDGVAAPMRVIEGGVSFPPGNGGLSTMRLVCTIESTFAAPLSAPVRVAFSDGFEPARLGWREMTVAGSGVTISGTDLGAESASSRLTAYPSALSAAPDTRAIEFTATPGGPTLPPLDVPDASPIDPIVLSAGGSGSPASPAPSASASASASPSDSPSSSPSGSPASASGSPSSSAGAGLPASSAGPAPSAAVPSGEGAIPDVLRSLPATPVVALLALLTAVLLGAGHALTPGHGKTLMAAYLVGTRGSPRHALGLGAAVSVSHTAGIMVLAIVVLAAESALPPDLVVRVAPVIAALTIVAVGGWMLLTEVRRWVAVRRRAAALSGHTHDHAEAHVHGEAHAHAEAHEHEHEHLEHSHGGIRHTHVPPAGSTVTWRSLAILGLAGGLIPSTNALLILLATIAAGRPAWGIVLVVAFGLGMAAVMAGVGLAFVYARGLLERGSSLAGVSRVARLVPLAAAVIVLTVGIALTSQALAVARLG